MNTVNLRIFLLHVCKMLLLSGGGGSYFTDTASNKKGVNFVVLSAKFLYMFLKLLLYGLLTVLALVVL